MGHSILPTSLGMGCSSFFPDIKSLKSSSNLSLPFLSTVAPRDHTTEKRKTDYKGKRRSVKYKVFMSSKNYVYSIHTTIQIFTFLVSLALPSSSSASVIIIVNIYINDFMRLLSDVTTSSYRMCKDNYTVCHQTFVRTNSMFVRQ